MSNPEHVELARQGTAALREWVTLCDSSLLDLSGADLTNAFLYQAPLGGADLRRALLLGASLQGADLSFARLQWADLSGAHLVGANLYGAKLGGATLVDCALEGATLDRARLRGANLEQAGLVGAEIARCRFLGSRLADAEMGLNTFRRVDLSGALGLEVVRHAAPSSIALDTLSASRGRIPESFLRGCGLQDWEIKNAQLYREDLTDAQLVDVAYEVARLRTDPAQSFYSAFISHSSKDKPFARRLHDALQERGVRCWLDEKQILPGDNVPKAIAEGIRIWDKMILCASQNSLKESWWVDHEMESAVAKERKLAKSGDLVLIPVNLDGYMFGDEWQSPWREKIRDRHAADFTADENFDEELERLVTALRADSFARQAPPTPKIGA